MAFPSNPPPSYTNGLPPHTPFTTASSSGGSRSPPRPFSSVMTDATSFDIFEWHPAYQSCQKYFIDHAQHDSYVQALAALLNICLPFQWMQNPVSSTTGFPPTTAAPGAYPFTYPRLPQMAQSPRGTAPAWVSLVPYIRRLVVTGFDGDGILHGFFGDDWRKGVGPIQECERRNYLFAAKSVGWAKVKYQYDISPYETVPFLRPLQQVQLVEIERAEKLWSQWLAMEDWMIGPRAPESMDDAPADDAG